MSKLISSIRLEQHVLAGLFKHPEVYHDIAPFISNEDFTKKSKEKTVFEVVRSMINQSESVDPVVVAQRIDSLKISFGDKISPFDYLQSLAMRQISKEGLIQAAKDLKKISVRRSIISTCKDVEGAMVDINGEEGFSEIISKADEIYNEQIDSFYNQTHNPENIFETMEQVVEERGENPVDEIGFMGDWPRVNEMYGSLLRPGNISVICARSGASKTTLAMDYTTKISAKYDVPVLHYDNGEMSKEELQMRQCAAMSGVPFYYLETGRWRQNEKYVNKVREVWKVIKPLKFYYQNVGGESFENMKNILRRFYFSKIGRGNKLVFSFDYFKAMGANENVWLHMGNLINSFKTLIHKDIICDGQPQIAMFSSVQSNRLGINTNRERDQIEDSEAVVGLSDMITQICSHLFLLRKKTRDEIISEGRQFGTHKLILLKGRHLGKDVGRALDLVQNPVDNTLRQNYVNLDISNFSVTEKGDYVDYLNYLNVEGAGPVQDG